MPDSRALDAIQIVTTCGSREEALTIGQALITRRLAACVQIGGPVTSCFRWENAVQTEEEWLCTVKTRRDRFPLVEAAIRELHSYDVPEILATAVVDGGRAYLDWIRQEVS